MHVHLDLSPLEETKWYEYAIRFLFGGLITAIAGIIANKFGPVIGGLFLAFPAIFPASATLIEKHEKEKARAQGKQADVAARKAVAVDAAGAALGCVALFTFALIAWQLGTRYSAWRALLDATAAWTLVSLSLWWAGDRLHNPGGISG